MFIKRKKLANKNGRCEGFNKSQIIEVNRFNFSVLRRDLLKKRGPQNEGITLWFAQNKGDKNRLG
jgi:hypothetical protein